ncbi:ATPase, AAA family protein, partial [Emiliania huxleyi CCMP1516]
VGGYSALRERLHRLITWPAERPDAYARLGIAPPGGALLLGPPGNGKTLLAHAAATASGCTVLSAKGPALFGEYVGDTEAAIRELFRQARECAPSLVVIDEIDTLGARRGGDAGGGEGEGEGGTAVARRALSALLNELDGLSGRAGVFLLGCTSQPEALDAALLRPGR